MNIQFVIKTTVIIFSLSLANAFAESILIQSTTSTKNSGLYDYILPFVKLDTGITVNVVAVGTGQAIKNAQRCDGDVLLVHAKASEESFVRQGYGVKRDNLMYNDFIIVGPESDPAGIFGLENVTLALATIASKKAFFTSRGDNSGTHKAELELWKEAEIDPTFASGLWYLETGSGMGTTLNLSVGKGAYAITDRATWIRFANKGDFKIHVEGDERMVNQYGVILVNKERCPRAESKAGQQFIDWLLSNKGQRIIASYKVQGNQLFFPNAD